MPLRVLHRAKNDSDDDMQRADYLNMRCLTCHENGSLPETQGTQPLRNYICSLGRNKSLEDILLSNLEDRLEGLEVLLAFTRGLRIYHHAFEH